MLHFFQPRLAGIRLLTLAALAVSAGGFTTQASTQASTQATAQAEQQVSAAEQAGGQQAGSQQVAPRRVPDEQANSFAGDIDDSRNDLIKAMTGIDPLTRETITDPPYGADGWMPIAADSLVRFAGTDFPNVFNNDGVSYTKDAQKDYIRNVLVRCSDTYSNNHQPFAITVQQRRDHGRRTEPVVVYFVARQAKGFDQQTQNGSWTTVDGDIYVQSMIEVPECTTVGHCSTAEWDNLYSAYALIHHTRTQDDMMAGSYSNNIKRNEAFDAITTASACDLDGDGYDEILVFYGNKVSIFDGKTYEYKSTTDLSSIDGNFVDHYYNSKLSYGYKTTAPGFVPNTWTSVVTDVDGDGADDVLALCHSGFYWDHLTARYPSEDSDVTSETGTVRTIFLRGAQGLDVSPVINSLGATPTLQWNAEDPNIHNSGYTVKRYKRFPRWNDTSYNNHDGVINHDMYHYYYVTLTADVIYPNGQYNSTEPSLAVAWKYMWSDCATESGDISYTAEQFRTGLHEWYQLSTYNLTSNRSNFTKAAQPAPSRDSSVDIYQLLEKAGEWHEGTDVDQGVIYYLDMSPNFNNAVNARASLRRPALKTWYAGGRMMPPFLFFEGMNLYYNNAAAGNLDKYTIASANPLGNNCGWNSEYRPSGRICGPIFTFNDHIDEDGALDDCESIVVPMAVRAADTNERYYDNQYSNLVGRFSHYDATNQQLTLVTSENREAGIGRNGQNTLFHYLPFTAVTAKVDLQGSYYTASNPIVKAVLAIPPFNTDDVVNPKGASASVGKSSDSGSDTGGTSSSSVGGGFSIDIGLFKLFKFGYSYNYKKSWGTSWGESQKVSQQTEYSSAELKDMVLFNYIPVDCFEYKVTASPNNPSLVGKTFTFRRALNMLYGEAHMPEVCWTVDDYNRYVAGAGLPVIDKNLLPHRIGVRNSYRRVDPFASKETIIQSFPLMEGGFWAVNDGVSMGTSNVSQKLSISNGHSTGTSESVSQDHKVSFGVSGELVEKVFAGGFGVNASFGYSNSWSTKTSWSESMSVSGKIPALKDVKDTYTLHQVWYEYEDPTSGQNFLVLDWAVDKTAADPIYVNLDMVYLFSGIGEDNTGYYMPQLNWSVNANNPVDHCVLEYKLDGITPERTYDDMEGSVSIDGELTGWIAVDHVYDYDVNDWVELNFNNTNNKDFNTWEHYDIFNLTREQRERIKEAVADGDDIYVHYRVKVYNPASASAPMAKEGAAEDNYAAISNEVSGLLFEGKNPTTSIENLFDTTIPELPVEIYTLQGIRVSNPDNVTPGIYIRRQGDKVTKVLVR